MIELLSPVGNFECLKSAVQNGADAVYFGANNFSARAFADNFDLENLQKAITYAKIRGVKTNLTLNTIIKDNEFNQAVELAKKAYEFGIDAIIVQDLGLAMYLMKTFPDLPIHASTQMTTHNLKGVLELEDLGFKRVVLSRELSANEIEHICKNSNIDIECFIHGALCISYSGQCLLSSMLGGRSGNRGQCAGPCRLPYELLENDKKIDSGYLLSTRDLCGLDYIPFLINAGVSCFKIEGRMKSPEYVAIVTKIYRKYIDLALSNEPYVIDETDRKNLLQAFNRGMSSSGHFSKDPNRELVFKEKPNNMGLFLGIIEKYNKNKGLITLKLKEKIQIGDTISLENESGSYTISELMDKNHNNIIETEIGQTVNIGRMKGNIHLGDKIYKISSKSLFTLAKESYQKENKKIPLNCKIIIKKKEPISITVTSDSKFSIYTNMKIEQTSDFIPLEAQNQPLDKQTIITQFSKTASTPFEFSNINIDLDENIFIPKLSILNELRRSVLEKVENYAVEKISRNSYTLPDNWQFKSVPECQPKSNPKTTSLLLNILNLSLDYSKLDGIDNIYIPLKYFTIKQYENIITTLSKKFNIYIYMPTIIKSNYRNLIISNFEKAINTYNIKGVIISNICSIKFLNELFENCQFDKNFEIICNYTFNVFNIQTVDELKKLGVSKYTLSPELDEASLLNLCQNSSLASELIVYGKTPLVNMNYCLLGETNKCYPNCKLRCTNDNIYYLKDRLGMKFRILPDNIQTVTTIFNCKTTNINPDSYPTKNIRIDILDENIEEILEVIHNKNK